MRRQHPIRVRGAQRPDIDPELLAQIVLAMAHQLASEAAASDDPMRISTNDGTDTEAADRHRPATTGDA
jgi:hypothetical protein